jgi:hypothetical protein
MVSIGGEDRSWQIRVWTREEHVGFLFSDPTEVVNVLMYERQYHLAGAIREGDNMPCRIDEACGIGLIRNSMIPADSLFSREAIFPCDSRAWSSARSISESLGNRETLPMRETISRMVSSTMGTQAGHFLRKRSIASVTADGGREGRRDFGEIRIARRGRA